MAQLLDLSREVRDMIYSFLFQQYRISATIQNINPVIMYAWKLTRTESKPGQNQKDQIMAITEVNHRLRLESLVWLYSMLNELRFDQDPRSTLSIPPKYVRKVEIVRGFATSPLRLSALKMPALRKIIVNRPHILVRSELLFESFLYVKGRVEQSWVIELRYFCLPGTLLHEAYYGKGKVCDLSCHCDVVLEDRAQGPWLRPKRKLTIFDLRKGDMVILEWPGSVKSVDR